jgi:hypothetical protein
MCDWEGCTTTGTIGLPNPNRPSVVKTTGFIHHTYRYTARVHRDRFLAFEGEGMTWMRQPSWQGIALFSVRMEFWRSTQLTALAGTSVDQGVAARTNELADADQEIMRGVLKRLEGCAKGDDVED